MGVIVAALVLATAAVGLPVANVVAGRPSGRSSACEPACRHWWRRRASLPLGAGAALPGPFCGRCVARWWPHLSRQARGGPRPAPEAVQAGMVGGPGVTRSLYSLDHHRAARQAAWKALNGGDDVA